MKRRMIGQIIDRPWLSRVFQPLGLLLIVVAVLCSCAAVKPYQKINLNDPDMKLSAHKTERFETNYQVYREGASGANGGKSGGGCGCN